MESFIIFTKIWQLKLFMKNNLLVYRCFKTSPRGFYQTLNFMGFIEDVKMPIPLIFVPMTNKSFKSYNNIINSIKHLFKNSNNIDSNEEDNNNEEGSVEDSFLNKNIKIKDILYLIFLMMYIEIIIAKKENIMILLIGIVITYLILKF